MWGVGLNWVAEMAVYRLLDYSLNDGLAVQFYCMHTALLIFIKIKAKQITFVNVIVIQIFGQLPFASYFFNIISTISCFQDNIL